MRPGLGPGCEAVADRRVVWPSDTSWTARGWARLLGRRLQEWGYRNSRGTRRRDGAGGRDSAMGL